MNFLINSELKNENKNLVTNTHIGSKLQTNILFISICLFFISISLWTINYNFHNNVIILNKNQQLLHIISDKFLSFGLDSSLLRDMKNLPIQHKKFINLAGYLSPAYLRIGGTDADCLYFNQTTSIKETNLIKDKSLKNIVKKSNSTIFILTSNDFLSIYKFSQEAGIKMIFDLNTLLRNADGTWNSNNAREIILFAKSHGMELEWQMGNEPNSFYHVFNITISPEQLAKDYCKLRLLLNELGYEDSILVGPEANHIGDEKHQGALYGINFLNNVRDCIDYFTWHQYYLNGHIAQLQDFLNPKIFNRLPEEIKTMTTAIKLNGHNISMWLSETSSAYGGGAPELSDRFVAGFLWLDKLGYSAKAGIQVVIRQSFFGGNYAMIDQNFNPNPDWWVALIFKQLVSNKVLNLSVPKSFGNLRLYAHCALKQTFLNRFSQVIIYGINLNKEQREIYIQGPPTESTILSYIFTSDNLQSRNIFLNGEILKLLSDGTVPPLKPKAVKVGQGIKLPSYSMVFLLVENMEITSCKEL